MHSHCLLSLGHNLPDKKGNRYCINLVSVAGKVFMFRALSINWARQSTNDHSFHWSLHLIWSMQSAPHHRFQEVVHTPNPHIHNPLPQRTWHCNYANSYIQHFDHWRNPVSEITGGVWVGLVGGAAPISIATKSSQCRTMRKIQR